MILLLLSPVFVRIRRMAGMKETQLTADVELLTSGTGSGESKTKQQNRPPISMNFEVTCALLLPLIFCS